MDHAVGAEILRVPPHSLEAERCLIGSAFIASVDETMMADIIASVSPADFFLISHQFLFEALISVYRKAKTVDWVLLRNELERRQQYEEAGGFEEVFGIINSVPSYHHALHYAAIVREKSTLRAIIKLANDALQRAYAPTADANANEQALQLSGDAARIATERGQDRVWTISEAADEVCMRRMSGEVRYIPTMLSGIDELLGGFRLGQKHIIGAKPGMGKSMLAKQIALNMAFADYKVGIISIEEDRHKIAENALSNIGGVHNNRIARDTTNESEQARMNEAAGQLNGKNLFIVDTARSLDKIIANARILKARHGCEVIIVDHLHIIDSGNGSGRDTNRNMELTKISAALKWTWKDLGVAGVECAQLNRDGDREPTLKSLRDSGSLEQDADVVILLTRDDYYRPKDEPQDGKMIAMIRKNKSGAIADVPLKFVPEYQNVRDWTSADDFG